MCVLVSVRACACLYVWGLISEKEKGEEGVDQSPPISQRPVAVHSDQLLITGVQGYLQGAGATKIRVYSSNPLPEFAFSHSFWHAYFLPAPGAYTM